MVNRELNCGSCGVRMVFTTAERDFYQAKGFVSLPNRCRDCLARARGEQPKRKPRGVRKRTER